MGNATHGNKTGCTLQTSADPQASDPFDSGFILSQPRVGQVIDPRISLPVFDDDTKEWKDYVFVQKPFISGKNLSRILLKFTTRSRIDANGHIVVRIPVGYFVAGPTASSSDHGAFNIVQRAVSVQGPPVFSIQTTVAVESFTNVTITLFGLVLGSSTDTPMVTLTTSTDTMPSPIANFMPILPSRRVAHLRINRLLPMQVAQNLFQFPVPWLGCP